MRILSFIIPPHAMLEMDDGILLDGLGVRDDRDHCRCRELLAGSSLLALLVPLSPGLIVYSSCFNEYKQAYVGFASDINAVVVVFRGTQENRY